MMRFSLCGRSLVVMLVLLLAQSIAFAGDLSERGRKVVSISADRFLGTKAATKDDDSVNGHAWDCFAAAALAEAGDARAMGRVADASKKLIAQAVRTTAGRPVGWTNARTSRQCVPGPEAPCQGSSLVYAYQTGLAVACLAEAGRLTKDQEPVTVAREVMQYWEKVQVKAPCRNCSYFRVSDSGLDDGQYVRNMNVIMAYGAALLSRTTGDPGLARLAREALQSDMQDRASGFKGYFGALDPKSKANATEAERIENHEAILAMVADRAGEVLKDAKVREHALAVWRDWAECDNQRCRTKDCSYWAGNPAKCQSAATSAHCAFRSRDPLAKKYCEAYLNAVEKIGSYGVWAVSIGGAW